jgi:serine phosphatase RsbU (regulator of sigma subunit)/ligand-binding sensor domain-containing protein
MLPVKNFSTKDYNGLEQIFDIQVDSRGIVYAANGMGLLELSGNSWKIYKVNNESNVRAITIDPQGRIFVGAQGEIGYFSIDSAQKGMLTYHVLCDENDVDFGNIKYMAYHDGKVYFESKSKIFIWDYDTLKLMPVPLSSNKDAFELLGLISLSGKLLTPVKFTGYYIVGDSLQLYYRKKSESDRMASFAIPFDNQTNLFLHTGQRLSKVQDLNGRPRFNTFHTGIDSLLTKLKTSSMINLDDHWFAIGTNRGIYVLDKSGKLIRILNKNTGLISNYVTSMSMAPDGRLWVGTEEGISVVSIHSPIEYFTEEKCNYEGRILNITRFNRKLFIITNSGLYHIDKNTLPFPEMISTESQAKQLSLSKFSPYIKEYSKEMKTLQDTLKSQLVNPCWDLSQFHFKDKDLLLVATQEYIVGINKNGNLEKLLECYPYESYQSKTDPRRVYIGLDGGLQSVYLTPSGKWIDEGRIPDINEVVINITEDDMGNLWYSTVQKGVFEIKKPVFKDHKIFNPEIHRYTKGLLDGVVVKISKINGELVFLSNNGVYKFNTQDSTFELFQAFGKEINHPQSTIFGLTQDNFRNLWTIVIDDSTNTTLTSVFYSKLNAEKTYHSQKIFAIENELVNDFYPDTKNITWFGGTYGLSKADAARFGNRLPEYNTYITTVLTNQDTAFGGYYFTENGVSLKQPESYVKTFDYKFNSFTFYFSAASPNDLKSLKYSWYMEGYENEKSWTPWTDKTYKEYTNLYEGDYTFHVRAMDVYGNVSHEATYSFSINPPWYRTIWAFIGYILFFVAFVWGAIRVSTRSLKRIIKEATAEIQQQKDELEEKNRNIIDSIRYAQRIQEAVIPSESQFKQVFKDSFILWRPRDIVSGDFYWMMRRDNQVFVTAADCTGHGVPGAFMSIMGISFLNQITGLTETQNAADALNMLRHNVITSLNKEGSETATKDGMDIALCIIDFENMKMDYAGAYNPAYIIRNGELIEIKADRMPIGVHERDNVPFTNKTTELREGDLIYLFSDGYIDQFGGPKGKKFMSKRFKRLLLEIYSLPMEQQKEKLWQTIIEWRGDIEQVDDIIILGIRI